ncbi:Growth hormone-regulated TBC protein 1 [Durusdinium trenchii]
MGGLPTRGRPPVSPPAGTAGTAGSASTQRSRRQRFRQWRRRVKRRLKGCFGLSGRAPEIHPAVVPIIERKRTAPNSRSYRALVAEAEAGGVPAAVVHQIQLDVARTFPAIPEPSGNWGWSEEAADRESCLARVLMAFECRALDSLGPRPQKSLPMLLKIRRSWCGPGDGDACVRTPLMRHSVGGEARLWAEEVSASNSDPVPTYVQGCSMMAAMCLGFTAGREEEGFWIFTYLMEDVLGPEFFSRRPAMMGYHGDKAALAQLVASTMPELAERLGTAGLAECVSALAARCLLSGFVGFLSGEPLVAFWEELLANHWPDYPRLPLLLWFTGLVQHAERQLQQAPSDELVPIFFRTVQSASRELPRGWRPVLPLSQPRALELRQVSQEAQEKYRQLQEELNFKEMHAKQVSASLDRSAAQLADALKLASSASASASAASAASAAR